MQKLCRELATTNLHISSNPSDSVNCSVGLANDIRIRRVRQLLGRTPRYSVVKHGPIGLLQARHNTFNMPTCRACGCVRSSIQIANKILRSSWKSLADSEVEVWRIRQHGPILNPTHIFLLTSDTAEERAGRSRGLKALSTPGVIEVRGWFLLSEAINALGRPGIIEHVEQPRPSLFSASVRMLGVEQRKAESPPLSN